MPITAQGREQIRAAGAWVVARYAPVHIVTSPFTRARQSAEVLADLLSLPVTVEEDLRERSYGTLAGEPYAAARAHPGYDPQTYWRWSPPGGGETLVEVAARAGAVLDRVAAAAPNDDVVVVSHGAVMLALWRHVTGEWKMDGVPRNAGIVVVEHRGGAYERATAIVEE